MSDLKELFQWVRCPGCGARTQTKVYPNTVLLNFPLYCPSCQMERRIDVVDQKMKPSEEPEG